MSNLTLAIDADLLKRARKRAIDQGTSVNAVVREHLVAYAGPVEGGGRALVERLREQVVGAAQRHGGKSIALVGSAARGQDGPGSDLDFLVEFAPGRSLFDQARLEDELETLLGRAVDVISEGGLKPRDAGLRQDALRL